ncbi:MAG: preprotein translocase subunit YajC [Clostridiales bacterium]|nr:preprotein translocase subunit YajC [Clostridiales bacterium]
MTAFAETTANPSTSPAPDAPGGLFGLGTTGTLIIYVVVIIALFYFMFFRPQKKKEKEKRDMLSSMKKGDKITTIGGISGKIAQIKDDTVVIEVSSMGSDKVKIEIQRWAIGTIDKASDEIVEKKDDAAEE